MLSTDELRFLLSDDPKDQSIHRDIFALMRRLLRLRLKLKRPVTVIDATNLMRWERRQWIRIAKAHRARVEAVFFDLPIEECQRRNRGRDRVVPAEAIEEMAKTLVRPKREEGFSRIRVLK
jgi:predicted kinase